MGWDANKALLMRVARLRRVSGELLPATARADVAVDLVRGSEAVGARPDKSAGSASCHCIAALMRASSSSAFATATGPGLSVEG
jgi:hypothetical protein